MFYDNFIFLCENEGISPSKLLVDLGISKGSLGRWREGGEPSNPTKKKIADFFCITVKQLTAAEIEKAPANKGEGAKDIEGQIMDIVRTMSEEQKKSILAWMDLPGEEKKAVQTLIDSIARHREG